MMTIVELTPVDAERFLQFQKNYENITALLASKALELNTGKVMLNIHDGHIMNIVVEQRVYNRIA